MALNMLSLIDGKGKIIWNPAYRVEFLDDGSVFLCSEMEKTVLKGNAFCLLAHLLLEGQFCADELAFELEGKIAAEMVYFALSELEQKKLIQSTSKLLPNEITAFCGLLEVTEQEAVERLTATKVYVEGDPKLRSLLSALQIQLVDDVDRADFSVVSVEDYLQPELETVNTSKPWLICKPYGSEIWVGPFFEPGKTGCYQCLATRLKINRLEESYIQQKQQLESFFPPFHAMLETTKNLAWNWIATEVFKLIILGKNEQLEGKIHTFNTLNLQKQEHLLIKRPTCSSCGDCEFHSKSPSIVLKRRKKEDTDGGFRSLSPEETLKNFAPLVSSITGVVKYLEPVSKVASSPIHVYYSGSNWALPDFNKGRSLNSFRKASGGKGTSEIAAKVSGLCEALERASGVFHGDERIIRASYKKLGEEAIHPNTISLFSPNQYENREKLNDESHSFWKVSAPFSEEGAINWTPLFSLTEQKMKYLPTSCCYYYCPREGEEWNCHADSNGCAAGNCLEEAILQGFLELVERDSIAIWWYNCLECPSVDLSTFQEPYIERFLQEYALRDREVWVLDITSDLGIPTFVALSRLKDSSEENIYMGFGAHLDSKIALVRALTEMNQFTAWSRFWEKTCFGEGKQDIIDKSPDRLEDINPCRKSVERRGIEFLVLDQTRPEIALSVARVVVPGLRHFWPRFAPGRLYDVPIKMGRLETPLKETELNPIGMFL